MPVQALILVVGEDHAAVLIHDEVATSVFMHLSQVFEKKTAVKPKSRIASYSRACTVGRRNHVVCVLVRHQLVLDELALLANDRCSTPFLRAAFEKYKSRRNLATKNGSL